MKDKLVTAVVHSPSVTTKGLFMGKAMYLTRYSTINGCLRPFFFCETNDDLDQLDGDMEWMDSVGNVKTYYVQESLRMIRKRSCWGWVAGNHIHYFARKRATMSSLVQLFAHELGHTITPRHRCSKEERKANTFADVATLAYSLAIGVVDVKEIKKCLK